MNDDEWIEDHQNLNEIVITPESIFVINEGNFMYGNATLSCLDTVKNDIQNDIFYKTNGLPLGDVAESMTIWKNKGYIVVNNSGKVYIIDTRNGKYIGKITGLTSPRFVHFVNDEKAYITDLYAGKISIFNPATGLVTGFIATSSHHSTEEMVQYGNLVFVTCWSGDHSVLVINTLDDQIIAELQTGSQPCGIVLDRFKKIWVLCQSQPGNNSANKAQLQRIDPDKMLIDKSFNFSFGEKPVKLAMDEMGENLLFILGNSVYKLSVLADGLPEHPYINLQSTILYGLGVDPNNGNIYVSDALDYQQTGTIYRYAKSGRLLGRFKAGIIPGRFCFN